MAKVFSLKFTTPLFISLKGEIGTGKLLLQIFLLTISEQKTKVLSPTFPIVNIYKIKKNEIWHYDLYRNKDKNEFFKLDFDLALNHCVLVEWPELMEEFFPKRRIEITFKDNKANCRNVKICLLGFDSNYYKETWKLLKKKFLKY